MSSDIEALLSELITLAGSTGAAASGTFSLASDVIGAASGIGTVASIVIPKGTTLKVWSRLVSGPGLTVNYQYAPDGSTYTTLVSDVLASTGEVDAEKRRPHVFRGSSGKESIQITWTGGSTTTASYVVFEVEVAQDA